MEANYKPFGTKTEVKKGAVLHLVFALIYWEITIGSPTDSSLTLNCEDLTFIVKYLIKLFTKWLVCSHVTVILQLFHMSAKCSFKDFLRATLREE